MVKGEVGDARPVPPDHAAGAPDQLGAVDRGPPDQVFGDALADEVGHGTLLLAREGLEASQLLLGELNLGAYHVAIFGTMMALYVRDASGQVLLEQAELGEEPHRSLRVDVLGGPQLRLAPYRVLDPGPQWRSATRSDWCKLTMVRFT